MCIAHCSMCCNVTVMTATSTPIRCEFPSYALEANCCILDDINGSSGGKSANLCLFYDVN